MISQKARYSIKALLALAAAKPGKPLQTREIAEQGGIPRVLSTCRPAIARRRGAIPWRYAAIPSSAISRHATIASERSAR